MNPAVLPVTPHLRRLLPPLAMALLAGAALLACPREEVRKTFSQETLNKLYTGDGGFGVTEYRLDSQPFSPTLPYLFDQARLAAFPAEAAPEPPPGLTTEPYAFTAIDRFGRLYHFDRQGRWWMAEGESLPETLPAGEWDAAWNPQSHAVEVLVSAPWAGERAMTLLRWRDGRWLRVALGQAPPARNGAARLFHAAQSRWLIAGGSREGTASGEGWTIEKDKWVRWGEPGGGKSAPALDETRLLIDGPAGSGPILLTRSGALWIWKETAWKATGSVKTENLSLARYVPALGQVLFVWARGRGQDQFLWQTVPQIENGSASIPEILPQTGLVRVNDRDEGLWKGWGRLHSEKDKIGQTIESLTPGFGGTGEPAVQLGAPDHDKTIPRSRILMLELPPSLATVRFEGAAWVPALGGLVVPSVCGMGIDTRHEPFFPPEAWDGGTSASQPMIDIIEHNYRLWVFRQKGLDWIKPPYETHPEIDYADSYETIDGRRRCLAWTQPEPGMLRYDFHEFHDKKVQWINSPRLTLKSIPQLAYTPGDVIHICDPVVWGDPAELIVVGWCGRMGTRLTFDKAAHKPDKDAFSQVPDRGFMARISALNPQQWKISTLPIPFCQGAQLVIAPGRGSLYLLGGKVYEPASYNNQTIFCSRSQNSVWHWDGESWRQITPQEGIQPRMKATSHVVYDSTTRRLLSLTPWALYGFEEDAWHCLWQKAKARGDSPKDVAMYVHPQSQLVLGAWFMPRLTLSVWQGTGWVPVVLARQGGNGATTTTATAALGNQTPGGALPNSPENLVPASQPDAFISLDARHINAMRMDAPRNRDQDRLSGAWWLTLKAANSGPIAYGRRALASETAAGTAVADTATSSPAKAMLKAAAPPKEEAGKTTPTLRVIEGRDGKVVLKGVKKTQTGVLLDRLETGGR